MGNFLFSLTIAVSYLAVLAQGPRDAVIRTPDGVDLRATYYRANTAGPGIVLFRNCDQQRESVDPFAKQLMRAGFHVISYDYRNGTAPGLAWDETRERDMRAVHDWLVQQPNVDRTRLASVGGSCGAELAMAFGRYANAKAVVSAGPVSQDLLAFVSRSTTIAVLPVASADDGSVQYGEAVRSASKNPASRLIVMPGKEHGMDRFAGAAGDSAVAWLLNVLRPSPSPNHR